MIFLRSIFSRFFIHFIYSFSFVSSSLSPSLYFCFHPFCALFRFLRRFFLSFPFILLPHLSLSLHLFPFSIIYRCFFLVLFFAVFYLPTFFAIILLLPLLFLYNFFFSFPDLLIFICSYLSFFINILFFPYASAKLYLSYFFNFSFFL